MPVTVIDVIKLIRKCPAKSCELDPLPAPLVREHATTLAPSITTGVNLSLQTRVVPLELKKAVVTLLKKECKVDPYVYKHYRLISNLRFPRQAGREVCGERVTDV